MARPVINRSRILRWQRTRPQRTKLWQAMRMLRRFTVGELQAVCEVRSKSTVTSFVHELRMAGFIRCVHRGNEALHEPAFWMIVRNTGPLSPARLPRRKSMWDPNTDQEHPFEQ